MTALQSGQVQTRSRPLTAQELRRYPKDLRKIEAPEPTLQGRADVARGRDGPFRLQYYLYGRGSTKLVFLSGHGGDCKDYYPFARKLGLDQPDDFTVLLIENRGINQSEGPWWSLCPMSSLANDAFDVLDFVGWTEPRSVHVIGQSMGSMMAMQMAVMNSARIATLTLIATTSQWLNGSRLSKGAKDTFAALMPKSEDTRLAQTKAMLYGEAWLTAPDPNGDFPTNGDAWAAKFLDEGIPYKAAIIQSRACVTHRVSSEQLRKVAQQLGGTNIQILHGTVDQLLPAIDAQRAFEGFGGSASGVRLHLFDGVGHQVQTERFDDVLQMIRDIIVHSQAVRDDSGT